MREDKKLSGILEFLASEAPHSRRRFIKNSLGLLAFAVFPAVYCGSSGGDSGGDAGLYVSFEVTFSDPMDRASVECALGIEPAVDGFFSGEFTWTNSDATVNYRGNVPEEGQVYTITLSGAAQSKGGNFLDGNGDGTGGDAYSFEVTGV